MALAGRIYSLFLYVNKINGEFHSTTDMVIKMNRGGSFLYGKYKRKRLFTKYREQLIQPN